MTINGGMRMRAWYDILGRADRRAAGRGRHPRIDRRLDELIAREGERGIPSERVILAGFSQGGAIVLAGGVRHATEARRHHRAVDLPAARRPDRDRAQPAQRDVPIFMGHGSFDPVVPRVLGMLSRDALTKLGYDVDWHSYPMAHQVCPPEIADLRAWIAKRLATRRPDASYCRPPSGREGRKA